MEQMRLQAEHVGTRMISDHVVKVELGQRPFRITGDSGDTYSCDALVIATGAQAKWLGLPSEAKFQGFGVSACATCDGFFFRGKEVVVVGGGNTAVEEALYLAHIAAKVTVVHRRDAFRAERILQDRLFKHERISVVWDSAVEEIGGGEAPLSVDRVRLRNLKTGALTELKTDGVFIAIGHKPATELFAGQLDMKPGGYLQTLPDSTATNIAGVYAAGDVTDDVYRQAVTAAGMGCMAALEAERFLAAQEATRQAAE
jgi:thioredoxin reductase (NADPH)